MSDNKAWVTSLSVGLNQPVVYTNVEDGNLTLKPVPAGFAEVTFSWVGETPDEIYDLVKRMEAGK